MPKEDYLLKYLEKLSRVIAAMFGFREKGYPEDALRLADETLKELIDFKIEDLAIMPVEKFIETIKNIGYSATYLEALGELAAEIAENYRFQNNHEFAICFFKKSLALYFLLNEKDKTFSFEREGIIADLKLKIDE
jgi:hypothetical protein